MNQKAPALADNEATETERARLGLGLLLVGLCLQVVLVTLGEPLRQAAAADIADAASYNAWLSAIDLTYAVGPLIAEVLQLVGAVLLWRLPSVRRFNVVLLTALAVQIGLDAWNLVGDQPRTRVLYLAWSALAVVAGLALLGVLVATARAVRRRLGRLLVGLAAGFVIGEAATSRLIGLVHGNAGRLRVVEHVQWALGVLGLLALIVIAYRALAALHREWRGLPPRADADVETGEAEWALARGWARTTDALRLFGVGVVFQFLSVIAAVVILSGFAPRQLAVLLVLAAPVIAATGAVLLAAALIGLADGPYGRGWLVPLMAAALTCLALVAFGDFAFWRTSDLLVEWDLRVGDLQYLSLFGVIGTALGLMALLFALVALSRLARLVGNERFAARCRVSWVLAWVAIGLVIGFQALGWRSHALGVVVGLTGLLTNVALLAGVWNLVRKLAGRIDDGQLEAEGRLATPAAG